VGVRDFMVLHNDTVLDNNFYYVSVYDTVVIHILADTVTLKFDVYQYAGQDDIPAELNVVITLDNDVIYDSIPAKGRVYVPGIALNHREMFVLIIRDAAPGRTGTYLKLAVGDTAVGDGYYCMNGQDVMIQDSVYCLEFEEYDSVDWDLYLVNESTNDTCWWKNPFPDWGVPDFSDDDPRLWGDNLKVDTTEVVYCNEIIRCDFLKDGTYSVYIRYFDGPEGGTGAAPWLNVMLGQDSLNSYVKAYYTIAPITMQKGETMFAGTVKVPEKTFDASSQRILPFQ
jgi:hypothetical protein